MTGRQRIVQELLQRADAAAFIGASAWKAVRRDFPGALFDQWLDGLQVLLERGAPSSVVLGLVRASPATARQIGAEAALALAGSAAFLFQRAGAQAAGSMLAHAPRVAARLKQTDAFHVWLASLRELAHSAPGCVELVCDRSDTLLSQLDAHGFHAWLVAGLTTAGSDPDKQSGYFSLSDASSIQVMEQESSDVRLSFLERRLQALVTGLWPRSRRRFTCRGAPVSTGT